jgi:hypothetical protein
MLSRAWRSPRRARRSAQLAQQQGGEFDAATTVRPYRTRHSRSGFNNLGDVIYAVTFSSSISNNQLTIDKNNVTFDLLGHQYQLSAIGTDITTAAIRVGAQSSDNAYLEVTNGTLAGKMATVGWVNGSADDLVIWTGGAQHRQH